MNIEYNDLILHFDNVMLTMTTFIRKTQANLNNLFGIAIVNAFSDYIVLGLGIGVLHCTGPAPAQMWISLCSLGPDVGSVLLWILDRTVQDLGQFVSQAVPDLVQYCAGSGSAHFRRGVWMHTWCSTI